MLYVQGVLVPCQHEPREGAYLIYGDNRWDWDSEKHLWKRYPAGPWYTHEFLVYWVIKCKWEGCDEDHAVSDVPGDGEPRSPRAKRKMGLRKVPGQG